MDSGEWRYVQRDGDDPRTGESEAVGPPQPAPNLWDDEAPTWGSAWVPQPRQPENVETTAERPASGGWPATSGPAGWGEPRPGGPGSPTWGDSRNGGPAWGEPPATATPSMPGLPPPGMPPMAPPAPAALPLPGTVPPPTVSYRPTEPPAYSPYGGAPGPRGSYVRTGVDNWVRPDGGHRRRSETDEYRVVRPRRDLFGDEPAYGPVLGLTAAWYGIPAVFYLVWLVTLDSDRQSVVGRTFASSLPWLFAAIVLSLAIAGLLRWAVVGWRAMTLSFASAVIGAGVTTIAHSLTL
jgi:hypothetical protein